MYVSASGGGAELVWDVWDDAGRRWERCVCDEVVRAMGRCLCEEYETSIVEREGETRGEDVRWVVEESWGSE